MQQTSGSAGLMHFAMFYRGEREFLDVVLPFVLDGVANSEPVHIALPTQNLILLRDALGDDAAVVNWADMAEVGRNPARTFPMFADVIASAPGGKQIRSVAEPIWAERTADQYPACVQNEALFNLAFADAPLMTLCPYDSANLPGEVIADARRTHPLIRQGAAVLPSPDYEWREAFQDCNTALSTDPSAVMLDIVRLAELSAARAFASEYASRAGMSEERLGDLNLVVTELATNSVKYTGGGCRLALWERDGTVICEVRDGGRLDDPLAGRRLPDRHSLGGRGLLLVNALADLVRMHTSETGTTIQVHLSLEPSTEPSMEPSAEPSMEPTS